MLTLHKFEIPEYLKQGELYRTLIENNDDLNEVVTFPADVLKSNLQVNSLADCDHLLNSLRFWGVDGIGSKEIISYVLQYHGRGAEKMLQQYETDFHYVHWLRQIMLAHQSERGKMAIESGLIELVQPLVEKGTVFPSDACDLAAKVGNLEVMKCLYKNGCQINHRTLLIAVECGHIDCARMICPHIPSDWKYWSDACDTAAVHGHVNILQYLHSVGFVWNERTTAHAAQGGNLHCLQYLHEQGCDLTEDTCDEAARYGHLHCLQYAHQHGCAIDGYVVEAAVDGSHFDCLQYAHMHGGAWTYVQIEEVTRAIFSIPGGDTVQQTKTSQSSAAVWDYLRIHAVNV